LSEDSTKYELRLKIHFALELRIYDPVKSKIVKQTIFKAEVLEMPGDNNDLESLLKEPLTITSPRIRKSIVGTVILSLRKNLKKFGRSAL